jgi:hypothetical protein
VGFTHSEGSSPTNPHWKRVVGYGLFSLYVIHKEGLCPSNGDINRLIMRAAATTIWHFPILSSITAWPRDIRRCEYSRSANGEASSDWNKRIAMYLSSHAQRRTAARPATETKVWISMAHATQSSTACRLAVRAASLRGQPVKRERYVCICFVSVIHTTHALSPKG